MSQIESGASPFRQFWVVPLHHFQGHQSIGSSAVYIISYELRNSYQFDMFHDEHRRQFSHLIEFFQRRYFLRVVCKYTIMLGYFFLWVLLTKFKKTFSAWNQDISFWTEQQSCPNFIVVNVWGTFLPASLL